MEFKVGDRVRVRTDIEPRSGAAKTLGGIVGTIISLHGSSISSRYAVLDVFKGHRNVGGVYLTEIELVQEQHVGTRKWSIGLKNGHIIMIKCNMEAIKELAEIIGDDRLEYITGSKKV